MEHSIPIPHHVCSVGEILTAVIEAMRTDQIFFLQFLCTAASHDEETFVNQLLILAQKPDAQSVSDREDWEKIGCQVGRESIVLLDEEDAYNLYPVWTEKQVSGSVRREKWAFNLLYELHIAEAVHRNSDTLEDALWNMIQSDAAHSEMEEFYESYRIATDRDAEYDSNYFLREYGIPAVFDEEDRRDVSKTNAELEMEWLWQFVQNAVHFQLMLRSGLNPFSRYSEKDFVLRDTHAKSRSGFLMLLTAIQKKTKEYMGYLRTIARQFPDPLPYSNAQLVSVRVIANELGASNSDAIWSPNVGTDFPGYAWRRLEYLKEYAYDEYLTELMEDSLASTVNAYGNSIRDNAEKIRESKIAQRKSAGMTDEQIAAEKTKIDMEINEILRDEYFYY